MGGLENPPFFLPAGIRPLLRRFLELDLLGLIGAPTELDLFFSQFVHTMFKIKI